MNPQENDAINNPQANPQVNSTGVSPVPPVSPVQPLQNVPSVSVEPPVVASSPAVEAPVLESAGQVPVAEPSFMDSAGAYASSGQEGVGGFEQTAVQQSSEIVNSTGDNSNMDAPIIYGQDVDSGSGDTKKKGAAKKIVLALITTLVVAGVVAGGLIFFLKSQKTSSATLSAFSEATSGLTTESSDLGAEIARSTYSSENVDLESESAQFDEAVKKFEDATAKLKSDKKDLKAVAEAYAAELKSYKENVISLAIDVTKVNQIYGAMEDIKFNTSSSSSVDAYGKEIDRISAEYAKVDQELKDLSLSNDKAKELRDAYVAFSVELQGVLRDLKSAVNAGDRSALSTISTKMNNLLRSNSATDKEEEVKDLLSVNSEGAKRLEEARTKLNDEIMKVNY